VSDEFVSYTLEQFDAWFRSMGIADAGPVANGAAPPRAGRVPVDAGGDLERVVQGCDFIRWARDHQAEVSEPLWYAMLSNLARLDGGREAAHAFSKAYPGYSPRETDAKFEHARRGSLPITCARIQELGFTGCPAAGHGVASPAALGLLGLPKTDEPSAAPGAQRPPAGLHTLSWREMSSGAPEPIVYTWHGWVARACVAMIVGAGESLKSWLALHVAVMLAAGRAPFDDPAAPASAPARVLYFTAENAIAEERRRARLLKAGLGLPDDLPLTFVPSDGLCLGTDADYVAVRALVQDQAPQVIVIDSAIALSGLADENDNPAVRSFMRRRVLPFARQDGAAVLLIGHSPKPPVQAGARFTDEHVARGASDWRNAADAVLYLRRDPSLGAGAVILRHAKTRVGARHAPVWFQLEDTVPGHAARIVYGGAYDDTSGQAEAAGLYRAVEATVTVLRGAPDGIPLSDLRVALTATGTSKTTARRAIDVVRSKRPWPGGPAKGSKRAVVTEEQRGKRKVLTFDPTTAPFTEPNHDDE
jgi:hypothetical protein